MNDNRPNSIQKSDSHRVSLIVEKHANPIVMKFGGTSVKDVEAILRAVRIIETRRSAIPVVVTSAMAGMTDALLNAVSIARKEKARKALELLETHLLRHSDVSRELFSGDDDARFLPYLSDARTELSNLLLRVEERASPIQTLRDEIASYGEQLSSRLLSMVCLANGIKARYVDARRLIITDDEFGSAKPIWDESEKLIRFELERIIAAEEVPIIGGFIGANRNGETTTLGRGGSDYSAAIFGAALGAREIQIWTDVTGVLTCDPRICADARTVEILSYEEAAELAYFGAKVLHPKTIQPAVDYSIPVRVCNSREPHKKGTMVLSESGISDNKIKSIAHKTGITILRISSARMLGSYGFMSALFQVFERFRTVIDVISTSEVSVAMTLENTDSLEKIVIELERLGEVEVDHGNAVVCLVGEGLREAPGIASKVFSTIENFNISLISHGASGVNMTFVVKEADVATVIRKLHREFFQSAKYESV